MASFAVGSFGSVRYSDQSRISSVRKWLLRRGSEVPSTWALALDHWVLLRTAHEAGLDGVTLDGADGGQEMPLLHRIAVEATLPEVAGPALPGVDGQGVAPMGLSDSAGHAVLALGHHPEVDMVGHEAVGPER